MAERLDQATPDVNLLMISIDDLGDDLRAFIRGLASSQILIKDGDRILAMLVRFDSEDEDLEDFLWEHNPAFLREIAEARARAAAGQAIPIENLDW